MCYVGTGFGSAVRTAMSKINLWSVGASIVFGISVNYVPDGLSMGIRTREKGNRAAEEVKIFYENNRAANLIKYDAYENEFRQRVAFDTFVREYRYEPSF